MNQDDYTALVEDRSRFYWWLATWFLKPPGRDEMATLPTTVDDAPPTDSLDDAWMELARVATDTVNASLEEIGSEYTRLFGGIHQDAAPPPPFESVWREDRLIGESTAAVIATYAEAGFAEIDPDAGPQDHIAVELKFIALLALREAEARGAKDIAEAQRRQTQQREFIDHHLADWAPRWADAIAEASRRPLYTALARLLKAAIAQTRAELAQARQAMPSDPTFALERAA